MFKITMTKINEVKKEGTKTVWIKDSKASEVLTRQQYDNCTNYETIAFFRRIGGSETVTRNYTTFGYVPTKIVSTSPDKQKRTIREFTFESISGASYLDYDIKKATGHNLIYRVLEQIAKREKHVLANYEGIKIDGNLCHVYATDKSSFDIALTSDRLGELV